MNNTDYLTGILSRGGLFAQYSSTASEEVQILFFDLDNFKTVNDMYGHKAGDDTLIRFAQILQDNSPMGSIISRLGGDEFVVIIPKKITRKNLETIAHGYLKATRALKKESRVFEFITCSIGILSDYKTGDPLDTALNLADKALYYAKEAHKDTYVFYSDYKDLILYEKDIEKKAVKALDTKSFQILYHPILHLHSSELLRSEACCVWMQPDGSYLGRNDFRPVLEKNGYIKDVDLFIFEQACKDMKRLKESGRIGDTFGVQLSYLLILDDGLIERLEDIMSNYGVEASDFEINVDEKSFGTRTSIQKLIANLQALHERGFLIALTKFGEDFSSIRYLSRLPLSSVKYDGEFIAENIKQKEGLRVLRSITELGSGFSFTAVACEVNDADSMTRLAKCGFDAATGNFLGTKLPFDEYLDFLNNNLNTSDRTISYHFLDSFCDSEGNNAAEVIGDGVKLSEGISDKWGAVSFSGGTIGTNTLKLPNTLLDYSSYTVSMWICPGELQNWVSAFYTRYQNGFASFMPNIAGGRCSYRINEDLFMDHWYDAMTGNVGIGKWTHIAFTYDAFTKIIRLYFNGEMAVTITDVPVLSNPSEILLGGDRFQISYRGLVSGLQITKGSLTAQAIKDRYNTFVAEGIAEPEENNEYVADPFVHDPAIYEDPVSKQFYIYATEGTAYTSPDLLHWRFLDKVVTGVDSEAKAWTGSDAIWAPDIVKVGDEYRLYCSNSSWGVQQSCIFLAVSDSAKGPFIPKAPVLKTGQGGFVNGIDANIITDHATGQQYMVYGSFWGGVHILELDVNTGLAKEGQGIGKQIACRPLWNDGAIEGPYMIYHPETRYYYLFVSYGSLRSDYNIRVGRSKNITGPFLDYNGHNMIDVEDPNCTTGLMIACGYRWLTGDAYMGPGHNSVLVRENGEMYLVNHIRKLAFNADPGPGLLQIRKLVITPDGWPISLGQPYNSETLLTVREALLYGDYERIELRPSIPQGIQHAHPMRILEGGRLEMGSVVGNWRITDPMTLELNYGPITEFVHFEKGLDKESNKTTVIMGGLTSQGICTWAKKEDLSYIDL